MTIWGSNQIAEPNMGTRAWRPRGVVVAPRWWNPLDSAAIDTATVWAWRAQANDNVTWGAGPANYAASLVSVEGNLVSLVEGNGVVPWAGPTGWGFVAAAQKYFDTTVLPAASGWVMIVQFAGAVAGNAVPMGYSVAANQRMHILPGFGVNRIYRHGGQRTVAGAVAAGNMAIVGQTAYLNGVSDGAMAATNVASINIFIGAANDGAPPPASQMTANILAAIICDTAAAYTAPDITAIAAIGAGSMHNL